MTSLPGGAANRAGIRYEHWWTVLRVIDVLEGRAKCLCVEPYGESREGADLIVEEQKGLWAEQVKNVQSVSNWTILRLKNKGILDNIKMHILNNRSFQLITSTPAKQLESLSYRAKKSENFAEFKELIDSSLVESFDQLTTAWMVSSGQAWEWLKCVEIKHITMDSMFAMVTTTLRIMYAEDPSIIIALLREYCDDSLHERLTAIKIKTYLESKGIKRLQIDPDLIEKLHLTVERHINRVNSWTPAHGLVACSDSKKVINLLSSEDAQQVVVLDGPAGFGKSTIVADVAQKLEQEGWFVAIVKMDMIKDIISDSTDLGEVIGVEESPAVLITRVSNGNSALLIFDQLDAVSTYSGRMSDNFDAVTESLRELKMAPNVKVMLVVRTADLEGDPRLNQIATGSSRHTVTKFDVEDIHDYFADAKMLLPKSDDTLDLLRIPLHLSVFTRLSKDAWHYPYQSLQDLYAKYTEHIRHRLEERCNGFPWVQFTNLLIHNMNKHEMLSAPEGVLDCLSQTEIDAAISESIITISRGRVFFFHESYFDYLFARAFVASGNDLHLFLVNTSQYLFRRAQTRQILEYLVANDRAKFRSVVGELLVSEEIRTHLKGVIIGVLTQTNPDWEDWNAVEEIAWSGAPISSRVLSLLNRPGWFDAADANARWERWLGDSSRVEPAFSALISVAGERSERVKQLLQPYVGKSGDWEDRLRRLVMYMRSTGLVDFAIELINNGYLDFLLSPNVNDSNFWLLPYSVKGEDPAATARLMGAFLDRGLYCARLEDSSDPFESGHLFTGQGVALIIEIAEAAPTEFIGHILPFVREVAGADQRFDDFTLPIGSRWGLAPQLDLGFSDSTDGIAYSTDDAIFLGAEIALRKLAIEHLDKCNTVLESLQSVESKELRYLACRALTVCDTPNRAVEWLLEDKRNMYLGQASQDIIKVCSTNCSKDLFLELEDAILGIWPNWELGKPYSGHTQYRLLSALCRSRISDKALKRLRELKRKFPELPESSESPKVMVSPVGSPISHVAAQRMSDDNWLQALRKHNSTDLKWEGDKAVGGPRELAQELGNCAAEEPERFAQLALRFDHQIPAVAIENIISNVGSKVDVDLFMDVCNHAQNLYDEDVGRQICWALRDLRAVNNNIVSTLTIYSLSSDPSEEPFWMRDSQDSSIRLYTMGMNSTRGAVALAISSILFHNEELNETCLENLQAVISKLVTDPILAVRACAADSVRALLNHVPDQGLDMAEILFDGDLNVLVDEAAMHLLWNSIFRDPERFGDTLVYALNGLDQVAHQAGRVWATALLHDTLPSHAVCDVSRLPLRARCGAAEEFAYNPVESCNYLEMLLNDEDSSVRDQAIKIIHCLDTLNPSDLNDITDMIVSSAAFDEHFDTLINKLARLTAILPTATVDACHRAVELAGSELTDMRTRHAVTAHSLIKIILRLYRQSRSEDRAKCLDIIDKLTELNVFGLSESLEHER